MKVQQLIKYVTVFLTIMLLNAAAFACTGIRFTTKDGSVIYGRTLEFAVYIPGYVIVVPEGMSFTGTTGPNNKQEGIKWTTKYAFTGMSPYNYAAVMDGINEKGLAVGTFLFPNYAKYPALTSDNKSKALASWEYGAYLLSQFATVDEVKAGLSGVTIVPVVAPEMGAEMPLHYVVHDAQGNSMVIEYINGVLKTYDDPLGVITNSPAFDWHITNLSNYVNLSVNNVPKIKLTDGVVLQGLGQGTGLLGLPGDFTPPSRFVRAVVFSQSMVPTETGAAGVFHAFHILNQFDIPKGTVRGDVNNKIESEYTQWTSVSDLKAKKFYYRTYMDQQVHVVDLMKMNLKGDKVQRFNKSSDTQMPEAIPAQGIVD